MGQVFMGALRRLRRSVEQYRIVKSLRALAGRYGINQKTVAKWKKRKRQADLEVTHKF